MTKVKIYEINENTLRLLLYDSIEMDICRCFGMDWCEEHFEVQEWLKDAMRDYYGEDEISENVTLKDLINTVIAFDYKEVIK